MLGSVLYSKPPDKTASQQKTAPKSQDNLLDAAPSNPHAPGTNTYLSLKSETR